MPSELANYVQQAIAVEMSVDDVGGPGVRAGLMLGAFKLGAIKLGSLKLRWRLLSRPQLRYNKLNGSVQVPSELAIYVQCRH